MKQSLKSLCPLLLVLLLALPAWLGGCQRPPEIQPSGKRVKIGVIAPFSGADSAKGQEGLKGIRAAKRLTPYLRNGDAVELVTADDRNEAQRSLEALKKLVQEDRVSAVLTFSGSNPVLAMAAVADEYRTPILVLVATHPDITRRSRFVSQLPFDDDFQGAVAALYVRDELLIDRVAVFFDAGSEYSRNLGKTFAKKFKSIGGMITDMVPLPDQADDFEDALKRMRAGGTELIYLPVRAIEVIRIIQAADGMGWRPRMMGSDGLLSTVLTKYRRDARLLDGLLATDLYSYGDPLTAYGAKVEAAYRGEPTSYAAMGIEGYALLVHAMNRCGSPPKRACINRKLRSVRDFTGVLGKISIGPDGKASRPLYINAIHNGHMRYIVKVY